MNKMCHQKITAEAKWGAIPMNSYTVDEVYNIIKDSNFEDIGIMIGILEQWKDGIFETVDGDHDQVPSLKDGTNGWSNGIILQKKKQGSY